MTRHMSGPLREKAGSLLLGLFSLRDHVPPSVTPATSQKAPPPDLVRALVSWYVAGLFALASCPYKRHILSMLREGSFWRGATAEVSVEVKTLLHGGSRMSSLKELSALHVRGNALAGIFERVTSLLGQREICATVTAFEE